MSFGKDPGQVARIGGYGASASQQMSHATKKQTGGRRGPPSWADNYKPSTTSPDTIRILEGSYPMERLEDGQLITDVVPWYECTEHFSGTNSKSMICSAGVYRMDKKLAKPCRGCQIYWSEWNERQRLSKETGQKVQNPNSISMSDKYVFNVLIYGYFYMAPQLDKNNRIRLNNKNEPYLSWKKYEGRHQDAEYQAAQEKSDGIVQSWPVGHNHFITLTSYAERIQKSCLSCGGQDCIYTQQWVCPACNAPTLDVSMSSLRPEQIQELVSAPFPCKNCNVKEYPRAIHGCTNCAAPRPSRLYDVDMQVQRIKQGPTQYQLIIPTVYPPRAVDPKFNERISKASDLSVKFAITSMDEQTKLFGHAEPETGPAPMGAPVPQPAPLPQGYAYNYPPQPLTAPAPAQQPYYPPQAPQAPAPQYYAPPPAQPQTQYYAPPVQPTQQPYYPPQQPTQPQYYAPQAPVPQPQPVAAPYPYTGYPPR